MTQRFWHGHGSHYSLFVSELVIAELTAVLNRRLGLATPVVCTPEALIEEDSDG